jgi:DNA-binding response OmpR family regulator
VALLAPADADSGECASSTASLGERERAVLAVLVENRGRVVDRSSLRRQAGLSELSPRRCDAVLVRVRAALGGDAIVTIRRRGWMLRTEAAAAAAAFVPSMRP